MSHQENITRIKAVYNALGELSQDVVFVGGATVSLYADRPAVETRPTDDVDILVEVAGYKNYAAIEEKLRARGFINDTESKVICRYIVSGIIVDVMPTDESILGFSNKWYKDAFASAININLETSYSIRIFKPEYFIATKLEAFKGRGENDGRTSDDFEDIVFVLNNRNAIWDELEQAPPPLKKYLKAQFSELLKNRYLEEWISVHLDHAEQKRLTHIVGGINVFASV